MQALQQTTTAAAATSTVSGCMCVPGVVEYREAVVPVVVRVGLVALRHLDAINTRVSAWAHGRIFFLCMSVRVFVLRHHILFY